MFSVFYFFSLHFSVLSILSPGLSVHLDISPQSAIFSFSYSLEYASADPILLSLSLFSANLPLLYVCRSLILSAFPTPIYLFYLYVSLVQIIFFLFSPPAYGSISPTDGETPQPQLPADYQRCPMVLLITSFILFPCTAACSLPGLIYGMCAYTEYRLLNATRYKAYSSIALICGLVAVVVGACLTVGLVAILTLRIIHKEPFPLMMTALGAKYENRTKI